MIVSRGLGIVQQRLIAVFESNPQKHFSVKELAKLVYPDETLERKHEVAILRATKALGDLDKLRVGRWGTSGWHYVVSVRTD